MANGWRRVTRAENAQAHKANRYTRAAPGKFRKSSKTISERQYVQRVKLALGKGGKEKFTINRRQMMGQAYFSTPAYKAIVTRDRNKRIRDLRIEARLLSGPESALVTKYADIMEKHPGQGRNDATERFAEISKKEQHTFKEIFARPPEAKDLIRGWLGSDQKSMARRRAYEMR